MIEIQFDSAAFTRDLNALPDRIRQGAENGLDRGGDVTLNQKVKQVEVTYRRSIPRSSTGRPRWRRRGNWLRGQEVRRTGELERTIVTTGPAEVYEGRLADLPTGPDGINRTNKASENAARIIEPQIKAIMEQAIREAIR
jgi:hypothetical protein